MIGKWRALKIEKLHVKGLKPLAFGKLLSCSWIYPRDSWGRAGPRLNRFKEFAMSLGHPDGSQWSLWHTLLQTLQCPWLDPYSLEQQRHLVISGLVCLLIWGVTAIHTLPLAPSTFCFMPSIPVSTIPLVFFRAVWKWKLVRCVWLLATPGTIQSMEFSKPEHWSG